MTSKRQVHLAAHFPGVNNTTVWSDERAESQIAFSSFEHFARNAERGCFDFLFLAEGLRLREQKGRIHDLDVVGRPNTLAILAAWPGSPSTSASSARCSTTFNEPLELAEAARDARPPQRRAGRLERRDELGRVPRRELPARWLPRPRRPVHPGGRVRRAGARALGLVGPGRVVADASVGRFADVPASGRRPPRPAVRRRGTFRSRASPQRHPVVVQAGTPTRPRPRRPARRWSSRCTPSSTTRATSTPTSPTTGACRPEQGRTADPAGATFTLGDTQADARSAPGRSAARRSSGHRESRSSSRVWNRDLSSYDVDGPLPDVEPDGRRRHRGSRAAVCGNAKDTRALVRSWRDRAAPSN